MLRILHDTNYDFIRWWKVMAAITLAFILLGLGSLAIKPPNYSIEFTGGTLMQLEFTNPPDVAEIRSTLDQAGIKGAEIQQFGTNREFTVRAQNAGEVAAQANGAGNSVALVRSLLINSPAGLSLVSGGTATSFGPSSVITGTGTVVKAGAGILSLVGSNSYSGGTVINGGPVSISMDNNLGGGGFYYGGDGFLVLNSGGMLQVTGTNDYAADRSGKFRRLAEIAEEIASRQEKVLVFTQFREITEPLAGFLATLFGRPGLVLHGGTSVPKRKEYVDRFQREDGPPFFVLSLKAGGTGLNLHRLQINSVIAARDGKWAQAFGGRTRRRGG